jgi:hypothetical protein
MKRGGLARMAMNGHAEAEGAAKQKHVEFKKKLSRAPSVESRDDESISAGAWKKHDANAKNKELLERKRRIAPLAGPQALGTVNPVFTQEDPLWNKTWQLVNPKNMVMQWWDILTLNLLIFTALVTPYEISFMDGNSGVNVMILFSINQMINIIFIFDMVFTFITPYEGKDGIWITSKKKLAIKYFRSMFLIDLLSVVPFDILAQEEGSNFGDLKMLRMLKLFRLLKMLRIFKGLKILKKYEADFAIDYQALNISALLLVLIVAAHWIACLIALICKYDDSSPHLNVYLPDLHVTNEQESTFKAYFYCFKWSLMWITTGYAEGQDEGIESSLLRGTTAMLLIIGALANAAIIGGVMTIVDEMNEASREFYSNLNTLNVYLKSEDVANRTMRWRNEDMDGVEFSRRLRRFYIYKFTNVKQYVALGNILQNVSMDMRRVLAEAMYGDILRGCGVFRNAGPDMIAHLAVNMRVEVYAQGDFVYSMDEPSEDLYFCLKGTVVLPLRVEGRAIDFYRKGGEPFGLEVVYKNGQPRGRSACCVTETVLLALNGDAVHEGIRRFGEQSIRYRIFIARNLVLAAQALKKATEEAVRGLSSYSEKIDADAGMAILEKTLGRHAMHKMDPTGHKENNMLHHFKRLVFDKLSAMEYDDETIEYMMEEAFAKHEEEYDKHMTQEVEQAEKLQDLLHFLESIQDDDLETMDKYFVKLTEEKVESIESLQSLSVTDLRALGMPLGDAVKILNDTKNARNILYEYESRPKKTKSVKKDIRGLAASKSFRRRRDDPMDAVGSPRTPGARRGGGEDDDAPVQTDQVCWTPSVQSIFGGPPGSTRDGSGRF